MAEDTIQSGGGTYARDAFRTAKLPHRYVVAIGKPHSRVIPAELGASAFPAIVKALRELSDLRGVWTPYNSALGTWVNDGKVYVDIVQSMPNQEIAQQFARERGELAIWDSVAEISIPV
jgi:hypothetical protein